MDRLNLRRRPQQPAKPRSASYRMVELGTERGASVDDWGGDQKGPFASRDECIENYFRVYREVLKQSLKDHGPEGLLQTHRWAKRNTGLVVRGPSDVVAMVAFCVRKSELAAVVRDVV